MAVEARLDRSKWLTMAEWYAGGLPDLARKYLMEEEKVGGAAL